MTETSIIKILAQWIDNRKYPFQLPNAFVYAWECDYWALDYEGNTKEFEIKISRSDFLNDAKKEKHVLTETIGANYFYYVCPVDLIKKEDVNHKYGLLYVTDDSIIVVKKPSRLNNNKFDSWKMLANKMYWKWSLLWREKYIGKEITFDEYKAGFNLELNVHE